MISVFIQVTLYTVVFICIRSPEKLERFCMLSYEMLLLNILLQIPIQGKLSSHDISNQIILLLTVKYKKFQRELESNL
jgi:hypothetical protein